jgi:hypothetical protein
VLIVRSVKVGNGKKMSQVFGERFGLVVLIWEWLAWREEKRDEVRPSWDSSI